MDLALRLNPRLAVEAGGLIDLLMQPSSMHAYGRCVAPGWSIASRAIRARRFADSVNNIVLSRDVFSKAATRLMAGAGRGEMHCCTILVGALDVLVGCVGVRRQGIVKGTEVFEHLSSELRSLRPWCVADPSTSLRFVALSFLRRLGALSPRGGLVADSMPDESKSVLSLLIQSLFSGVGTDTAGSLEVQAAACDLLPFLLPGCNAGAKVPMSAAAPSFKLSTVSMVALEAVKSVVTSRFPLRSTDIKIDSTDFHQFSCLLRPLLAALAGVCVEVCRVCRRKFARSASGSLALVMVLENVLREVCRARDVGGNCFVTVFCREMCIAWRAMSELR